MNRGALDPVSTRGAMAKRVGIALGLSTCVLALAICGLSLLKPRPPSAARPAPRGSRTNEPAVKSEGWILSGRVLRASPVPGGPSSPADGATVTLRTATVGGAGEAITARTGSDGRYELGPAPMQDQVKLEVEDGLSPRQVVHFSLPSLSGVCHRELPDVVLGRAMPLEIHLVGTDGSPLDGASVTAWAGQAPRPWHGQHIFVREEGGKAKDLGSGDYLFERLSPGKWKIGVNDPPCKRPLTLVDLPSTGPVNVRIAPAGRIEGLVVAEDGRPIPGARVEANINLDMGPAFKASTDGSGRFALNLTGDENQDYEVVAWAEGFIDQEIDGVPSGNMDLRFSLRPMRPYTIKVVDDDGAPVSGARLDLSGSTWREPYPGGCTDTHGLFRATQLPDGLDLIFASCPGFVKATVKRERLESRSDGANLLLRLERAISLLGGVVDAGSSRALDDVDVAARREDNLQPFIAAGASNDEGRFLLNGLDRGRWTIECRRKGYAPLAVIVDLAGPAAREVMIRLNKGVTLEGRAVDPDGKPVPGAAIVTSAEVGGRARYLDENSTVTAEGGRFRLEGLPETAFRVHASHRDFVGNSREGLEIKGPVSRTPVDLRLERGGTVEGRTLNQVGQPIPQVWVRAIGEAEEVTRSSIGKPSGTGERTICFTDEQGAFALRLRAGRYRLEAHSRDGERRIEGIRVQEGGKLAEMDLFLEREAPIPNSSGRSE